MKASPDHHYFAAQIDEPPNYRCSDAWSGSQWRAQALADAERMLEIHKTHVRALNAVIGELRDYLRLP